MKFKGFDIGFYGCTPLEDMQEYGKLAEKYGMTGIWSGSDPFWSGWLPHVAVACATKKLKLGLGTLDIFHRHPATFAVDIALLSRFSNYRLIPSFSRGDILSLDEKKINPLKALRECFDIVRGLLRGDLKKYDGEVFELDCNVHGKGKSLPAIFEGIEHEKIPLMIGGRGPKMLQLGGEISDGVILTAPCSPGIVKWSVKHVHEGARKVRRNPSDILIGAYIFMSIAENPDDARNAVRKQHTVKVYIDRDTKNELGHEKMRLMGFSDEEITTFREISESEGLEATGRLFTDEFIDKVAVVGTPDECLEKLAEYSKAGLELPISYRVIGPDYKKAIELYGKEIVPRLNDI